MPTWCARPIGKAPLGEAALRRHELAPDRIAALAVEHLAGAQVAFGDGDNIAAPALQAGRSARRAAPPTSTEMPSSSPIRWYGLYIAAYQPLAIGLQAVFLEAGRGVIVRRLEHDIDAPAQVAKHRPAVALERRDDLDHAVALQHAARRRGRAALAAARRRRRAGMPSPSCGTSRPQALATAAISIADLVPSRNELNICGFIPPRRASSGVRP